MVRVDCSNGVSCAGVVPWTEALLPIRSFHRGRIAVGRTAEVVGVPVPDMALIRPGHQLEDTIAVPVDRGHVHPVPPEFQWLAFPVEQQDDRLGEHRLTIGSDVPGEQDIAAAIGAAVLWADTDQEIEELSPLVEEWRLTEDGGIKRLDRTFKVADFAAAIADPARVTINVHTPDGASSREPTRAFPSTRSDNRPRRCRPTGPRRWRSTAVPGQ